MHDDISREGARAVTVDDDEHARMIEKSDETPMAIVLRKIRELYEAFSAQTSSHRMELRELLHRIEQLERFKAQTSQHLGLMERFADMCFSSEPKYLPNGNLLMVMHVPFLRDSLIALLKRPEDEDYQIYSTLSEEFRNECIERMLRSDCTSCNWYWVTGVRELAEPEPGLVNRVTTG